MARSVPCCANYVTVEPACELVTGFVDPALMGEASGRTWAHEALSWN